MEWRPISGISGYAISTNGQVRSTTRALDKNLSETISRKTKNVVLRINSKSLKFAVWKLLAETYLPNPNNYEYVIFRDNDPLNVVLDNIIWAQNPYTEKHEAKWEIVHGFPSYEISPVGIRNIKTKVLLKITPRKGTHPAVTLVEKGINNCIPVHHIMARQYVLNPKNLPLIRHVDGDKNNFNPANLEWHDHAEGSAKSQYSDAELSKMQWRSIVHYQDYWISDLGVIMSTKRNSPIVIEQSVKNNKRRVSLRTNDNGQESKRVSKLLASAFLPNPNRYKFVIHLDGNSLGDRLDNIVWADNPYTIHSEHIWESLIDFPKYEISPIGVRHSKSRKLLKPQITGYSTDYPRVYMMVQDSPGTVCVSMHILMARQYIPNPENLPWVNHIDGDKNNYDIRNLEWVTPKQNAEHAERSGLIPNRKGKGGRPIEELDEEGNVIKYHLSTREAAASINCCTRTIIDYFKKNARDDGTISYQGHILRYKIYESLEGEIWKPINTEYPDANCRYEVSNMGRVRNIKTTQILEQSKSGPYNVVRLSNQNHTSIITSVHRLVAFAFLKFTDRSHQVNHIDKNPDRNHVDNLEILSVKEHNMKDHGKHIVGFSPEMDKYVAFRSLVDAGKYLGFNPNGINGAIERNGTAGGFKWYYLNDENVQNFIKANAINIVFTV